MKVSREYQSVASEAKSLGTVVPKRLADYTAKVSPSLRFAVENLLITGRSLKRSIVRVCSDTGITDGSVRAFVVTSKDED